MDLQKTKLIVSKTVVSKSTLKELQDSTSLENLFSLWQDMPSPVIHAYSTQPPRKVEGKIQRPNEEKLNKKRKMDETFKIQNVDPLKVAYIQKVLMDLSFPQTDKPSYFPELNL